MAARMDGPKPKPGSARGQGAASTPPAAATVTSGNNTPAPTAGGVNNQTPHNASPQVPVFTAVNPNGVSSGGNTYYSSPRPVSLPANVLENELAPGATPQVMTPELEKYLTALAKKMGHNRTANSVWNNAVDIAQRDGTSVIDAVYRIAADAGFGGSQKPGGSPGSSSRSGGSSGRSGGSSGASGGVSQSVSYDNAPALDVRSIADSVAMEFLGRGVTQQEMQKILARVRVYENNNPSVSTGQSGAGVSVSRSQGGATTAGRQQVIERILAKNPEFGDYQKATTMMDWFGAALNERLQNG